MLLRLMGKVFMQLLAQIRNLGSHIVFADFSRIIICTRKLKGVDALQYAKYVANTIAHKDLFRWIGLDVEKIWSQLLWHDVENYGGMELIQAASQDTSTIDPQESNLQFQEIITMHWNLANYLTPTGREQFELVIGHFLFMPHTFIKEQLQRAELQGGKTLAHHETSLSAFLESLVQDKFTKDLMKAVHNIQLNDKPNDFPSLAGSHLQMVSPALECVKSICHIMQLDSSVASAVDILKVQLLRLLSVRDFSPESIWHNPSLEFVLSNIMCEHCNHCEDWDLCRNPILIDIETQPEQRWRCLECKNPYNIGTIEQRLVDKLETKFTKSQLQDLKCVKCGSVKADNLSEYCKCSGSYICTENNPQDMQRALKVFRRVAEWHKLDWLLEVVQAHEMMCSGRFDRIPMSTNAVQSSQMSMEATQ
jgi:DNA polymerase epsilon subunit 1